MPDIFNQIERPARRRFKTNILGYKDGIPMIEVERYSANAVRFYCQACHTFHYHPARVRRATAKCTKESAYKYTGYFLELKA